MPLTTALELFLKSPSVIGFLGVALITLVYGTIKITTATTRVAIAAEAMGASINALPAKLDATHKEDRAEHEKTRTEIGRVHEAVSSSRVEVVRAITQESQALQQTLEDRRLSELREAIDEHSADILPQAPKDRTRPGSRPR